ncbi:peptide MFS transporter [Phycicoccus sonneratiae]|uniref:MFS transporter n=1 Tax=Phycicoccus sonneratiae TaxID=2807628 RepID=A0ABS2CRE8_9MICO|nr:oligopeptide:H+ symporter [Phycicoccus sonneraticus]MBM6402013.1 MFS transporter [Phycicoccus sonneraticus]
MSVSTPTAAPSRSDRGFLGHPAGLSTLFVVELWERFSYYGMRAILLYFLVDTTANGGLGIAEATGTSVVAIYGSAVYLLSVLGGYAADRLVGARRSTLYGGLVIMAGHLALSVPAGATAWLGIALVALGTGLLKPNISAIVGRLYAPDDARRDAGFSIFYMSINLGALFSPLVVAFLRDRWGYHAGFSAAAVGMGLALVAFVLGRRTLRGAGDDVPNPLADRERRRLPLVAAGGVVAVALLVLLASTWRDSVLLAVVDAISVLAIGTPVAYFVVMFRSRKVEATERTHLAAYLPLWVGAVLFWMIFEQAAGKMALFAQERTVTSVGGLEVDPEWFQSVNPLAIIALAPLFALLWVRRAGRFPSTPAKFATGVTLIGASAFAMAWAFGTYEGNTAPVYVLGGVFVLQTVAELFLSPVGLSATTRLAPTAFASQAMALWFLATAAGQALAAQLITAMDGLGDSAYYVVNGVATLAVAAVMWALVPWIRRRMSSAEVVAGS